VLSSRVRLARNLAGRRFPARAGADESKRLLTEVLAKTTDVQALVGGLRLELEPVALIDRRILGERQHASPELVRSPKNRGIVVSADESRSFRINVGDHIRIQSMCSGLDLERAYSMADALDSELDARLVFAFDDTFGFLTANPANAGTGLRVSVLLHLPALVMEQKLDAVITDLNQAQCTVRGFRDEGGGPPGSLVQVSNSVALGLRESEILRRLSRATQEAMKREGDARERLLSGARSLLEDRVWRSFGILRHARLLSAQETLYHASLLRLGVSLGFLDLRPEVLQDLLSWSQDAHAQLWSGTNGHELARSAWRAEQVRTKLKGISA
jgi:protein arginine kinase